MNSEQTSIAAQSHNLAVQLNTTATAFGSFPAIASQDEVIPYNAFFAGVVSTAYAMREHGIDRTSLVALNTGSMRVSLSVLLATALLGCRFVIAGKVLAASQIDPPTHFIKSSEAKGKQGVAFLDVDESWMPDEGFDVASAFKTFEGYNAPDDDWMLLHTSGSTGQPKYFALTHRMVSLRSAAVADEFPVGQTTVATLFGPTSRPFFARALAALVQAGCLVDDLDPAFWSSMGLTTLYASPRQASEFFAQKKLESRFPKLELSGAHVSDLVAGQMLEMFDEVVDVYGASETSKSYETRIARDESGAIRRQGGKRDSEIEIRRPDGSHCPPGEMGEVFVKNNYLINGYISGRLEIVNPIVDGWYVPGDIALWSETGDFRVIGRLDDVISIGGVKIDATLIDLVIQSVPGVREAISFENPRADRPDEIAAFVVFEDSAIRTQTIADVREAYHNTLKLPCFLGRIHGVDAVPRDAEGKPNRIICKSMLLERSTKLGEEYSA